MFSRPQRQRAGNYASLAKQAAACSSTDRPAASARSFRMEREVGVGIHGEPGRRREKLKPAGLVVDELLGAILAELKPRRGYAPVHTAALRW